MASPGSLKGQRCGICGHAMAAFDLHEKCEQCRNKKVGEDPCVKGKDCLICEGFTDSQRDTLSTTSYKIRKDRRSGSLVSPKDVTIISAVDVEEQSSPQSTAQESAHAPAPSTSSAPPVSFVTSAQFEAMNDKWAEHFARFEALLSRGNVFSTPKTSVYESSHPVLSDKPFINPSARLTGPVVNPAEQDVKLTKAQTKSKKKSHKSKSEKPKDTVVATPLASTTSIPGPGDDMQEPVFRPVSSAASSITSQDIKFTNPAAQNVSSVSQTGQGTLDNGSSAQYAGAPSSALSSEFTCAGTGTSTFPEQDYRDPPVHVSDDDFSNEDNSLAEEGEVSSDNLEKQEQTEDMTFRETVRSVRSFMGWDYIPVFESDLSEPDKSNNPWRGKHPRKPARISVAIPPDDWLCQKLEKLNTTIAEGYPSRAQDSADTGPVY